MPGDQGQSASVDEGQDNQAPVGGDPNIVTGDNSVEGQRSVDVREQLISAFEILNADLGLQAGRIDGEEHHVIASAIDEIGDRLQLASE